jgi:cell division protein FtsX
MNKLISIAALAGGCVLLGFGLSASDSAGSGISRFFTGAPTDKAIWLIVGGTLAIGVGLAGVVRGWTAR